MLGLTCRALQALARETPESFRRVARALEDRTLALQIDDERFWIRARGDSLELGPDAPDAWSARFRADRSAILDVIDGELSLEDALRASHLEAFGAVSDLLPALSALACFVEGAVRSATQEDLLEGLREAAA
jgi:hypothetical protein